jgi:hypothetical protein
MSENNLCEREYDFALVLSGPSELTDEMAEALFAAGCDDATPSVCYGRVWLEFSRSASSYKAAVLSAIRDVRKAGIGADVERIDECNLVTQAEMARKIGKSPQYVHQLMTGKRGPGGFPPPVCHLSENTLLWQWCEVSFWLCENNIVKPEVVEDAEITYLINQALAKKSQNCHPNAKLVQEIEMAVAAI